MKKRKYYFYAFLIPFLIASLSIIPYIIEEEGILTLWGDFNTQQIPFGIYVNKMIKAGSYIYDWCNQLGNSFLESFSFYNLGSIFYWITLLFDADFYPYLIGPILILKFAIAGLTSFIYIKTFCKDEKYALIGSILYSFSGFQITNLMFNHFHDVVALFPLLLYTLDNLIIKNKKGRFCLVIALMAITNYFFFVGECVFLVIYFICNLISKRYKLTKNIFTNLLIEIILGLLLSGFLFYPSILNVLTNSRVNISWTFKSALIYENLTYYIDIIKSLILPPDLMFYRSFINIENFKSVELYLPFVSFLFVIPFIKNNKKSFITYILFILFLFMFIPILNSSFVGFNYIYYARWFYIPILIMSICTSISLEKGYSIKSGIISYIILSFIYVLLLYMYGVFFKKIIFLNYSMIIINLLIAFISFILIGIIFKFLKRNLFIFIFILVCVFSLILLDLNIYNCKYYLKEDYLFSNYKDNYLGIKENIKLDDDTNYRIYANQNNVSYIMDKATLFSFNSLIDENNLKFYNTIAKEKYIKNYNNRLLIDLDQIYISTFLSNKYVISRNIKLDESSFLEFKENHLIDNNEDTKESILELYYEDDDFTVYKNKYFIGFGILYDSYIRYEDFVKMSFKDRNSAYLKGVILGNKQLKKYDSYLKEVEEEEIKKNEEEDLENDVNKLKNIGETNFIKTNNGFKLNINAKKDSLLLLTFPYDKGWTAYRNGREVMIDEVSNGLMAIEVNGGISEIDFIYETKGQKIGNFMSTLGLLIYLIYFFFCKKCKS